MTISKTFRFDLVRLNSDQIDEQVNTWLKTMVNYKFLSVNTVVFNTTLYYTYVFATG